MQSQSQLTLSSSQEEAVRAPWEGFINMILSTAGSGKTLTLTRRAVWIASQLVCENRMNARLLCVCFNKSAAEEMYDRLRDEIMHQGLHNEVYVTTRAHSYPDQVTIEVKTFHAFGYWVLQTCTKSQRELLGLFPGKLSVLTGKDLHEVAHEALAEAGDIKPGTPETRAKAFARSMSYTFSEAKRRGCDMECLARLVDSEDPDDMCSYTAQLSSAYHLYQLRMQARNAIEFADMHAMSIKLVNEDAAVRSRLATRFDTVLVDEFQDMSPSDFTLCKFLVDKSKSLTIVGDDDQRIYAFRSSQTWFCHESVEQCFAQNIKLFVLPENRRCPGAVVKAADAVVRRNTRRHEKSVQPVRSTGCPIRVVACDSQTLEIRFVIRRVKVLLPKVRQSGEQILVLFRTNRVLQEFQKEMDNEGIEVSRKIVDSARSERFGPKTFAIFALITMISRDVDKETFIWAAMTVSPSLERRPLEEAVGLEEDGEVKSEASRKKKGPIHLRNENKEEDKIALEQPDLEDVVNSSGTKPSKAGPSEASPSHSTSNVSPLLDKLSVWFEAHKTSRQIQPHLESFYRLLSVCDKVRLRLRNIDNMKQLVQSAGTILSEEFGEVFELEPEEQLGSQQENPPSMQANDESIAGFDVLLDAARTIDMTASIQPPHSVGAGNLDKEDPDEFDFSDMFQKDDTTKRGKHKRKSAEHKSGQSSLLQREHIGSQVSKLANALMSSFLTAEKNSSRPRSKNNQIAVVLSTIHKAKGSQFAYVFLCGADVYHLPNGSWSELNHGGTVDLMSLHSQEERRMFFVSITRTKNQFTCSYHSERPCSRENLIREQSPFLQELVEGVDGDSELVQRHFIHSEDDLESTLKSFE